MRVEDYNIKSFIRNNKKVLIWQPGSNIDDGHFVGLGFGALEENNNNLFYFDKGYQLEKHQNKSFDYFFIHGFEARNFDINLLRRWNIKIDKLILDYLGEGFDIIEEIDNGYLIEKWSIQCNELMVLTGFKVPLRFKTEYPKVKFFEHDLSGPRIFCSRYNLNMVHREYYHIDSETYISRRWVSDEFLEYFRDSNVGEIVMGLNWSDNHKFKLYQWTPGTPRPFRIIMQKEIENQNLLDFGYVSFKRETQDNIKIWDNESLGGKDYECITTHCELDDRMFDTKFALHRSISKNSYISLVSESAHYDEINFITEKCVKPFYNLQFPLMFGHRGLVSDLRKMDFDMFDDIIDHSYDDIPVKDGIAYIHKNTIYKCKKIVDEISKLKNTDIHRLYLKNKERFIYNQENLYKKTILENDIFQKMAEFIFGDDLEILEPDISYFKKIWI